MDRKRDSEEEEEGGGETKLVREGEAPGQHFFPLLFFSSTPKNAQLGVTRGPRACACVYLSPISFIRNPTTVRRLLDGSFVNEELWPATTDVVRSYGRCIRNTIDEGKLHPAHVFSNNSSYVRNAISGPIYRSALVSGKAHADVHLGHVVVQADAGQLFDGSMGALVAVASSIPLAWSARLVGSTGRPGRYLLYYTFIELS